MSGTPKVFLCHASEDKSRFVEPFARALRGKGIDAFYDLWEIGPGDRLWERITRGIEESDAFILVASDASLSKPWVREEIGGGLAARLSDGKRFIVIVLDQCDERLPVILKARRYIAIDDPQNFNSALDELVESLHGYTRKPPLGDRPAYAVAANPPPNLDLTKADWQVLQLLATCTLEGIDGLVEDSECLIARERSGLSNQSFTDCLEMLEELGYLKLSRAVGRGALGAGIVHVRVTVNGFEEYLSAAVKDYAATKRLLIASIVNLGSCTGQQLIDAVNCSRRIARHVAEWLQDQDLAKASFYCGPDAHFCVYSPSVTLRRLASE